MRLDHASHSAEEDDLFELERDMLSTFVLWQCLRWFVVVWFYGLIER